MRASYPNCLSYCGFWNRGPQKIRTVYKHMLGSVTDVSDLFEVLDCLYALGMIEINGDNLLIIGKEEE